ncbi:conserved hypothetical protein [Rhodococcus jostii RHA1]|uniref:Uncharacterized protein n=1 Tax=Rhodococcus jostii (strain RHA1) TaxID=101510 RepID=Q0S1Z6_RHOJR|nr:conserved hypothetical protein [Rhodococcus jostii RHA1]
MYTRAHTDRQHQRPGVMHRASRPPPAAAPASPARGHPRSAHQAPTDAIGGRHGTQRTTRVGKRWPLSASQQIDGQVRTATPPRAAPVLDKRLVSTAGELRESTWRRRSGSPERHPRSLADLSNSPW